jgi:Zn-dependent peptidase ImmA (M78 family)
LEPRLEALVVQLILDGKTEEALEKLAKHHNVGIPKIKVGLPKGNRSKALGCYAKKNQTIYVLNSDVLKDPFTILHEFYHHLRTSRDSMHKGTEKLANKFAIGFIEASRTPRIKYAFTITFNDSLQRRDTNSPS